MYTMLRIEKLRGVDQLDIESLRRINLIVGRNNSGKTTVLESLFLLGGATNPGYPITLGTLRGQRFVKGSPDPLWRPLFYEMNPQIPIDLTARWSLDQSDRHLRIEALRVSSYSDDPSQSGMADVGLSAITQDFRIGGLRLRYRPSQGEEITTDATYDARNRRINAPSRDREDFVRTTFLSARSYPSLARDAQQYSYLLRIKQEREVLEAIKIIEPRVERIEVLSEGDEPSVYVDLGLDSLVPLSACGEGFVRLFSIVVEVTASRHGILLIDEIDNGLHYTVMEQLWKLLGEMCARHDVQIVATTHNDEMIRSSFAAFKEQLGELGLYRIDIRNSQHVAVRYDEESIESVMEVGFEVRG